MLIHVEIINFILIFKWAHMLNVERLISVLFEAMYLLMKDTYLLTYNFLVPFETRKLLGTKRKQNGSLFA